MSTITLDRETAAKFNGLSGRTELRDEAGTLIAYLMPVFEDLSHVKLPGPDLENDEEMAAMLAKPISSRPLTDILRDLRKL